MSTKPRNGESPGLGVLAGFAGELSIAVYERNAGFDGIREAIGDGSYLINGLALSLPPALSATVLSRRTPAQGLQWSNLGSIVGCGSGIGFGLAIYAQAGPALGVTAGVSGAIVGVIVGGLYEAAAPSDLATAATPRTVLERDRRTFFVSLALAFPLCACMGVVTALSPPDPFNGGRYGWGYGIGVGVACFLAIGLAYAFYQAAWGSFALASVWLAATRRTPIDLMSALRDAHEHHSVLRQIGPVYQFRHIEIQRRIGGSHKKT